MADIKLNQLDLQRLGDVRYDGGIRLFDENRDFRRIRQSARDVLFLEELGFVEVMSSNVSAVMVDGEDLLIRFHRGEVYRYPGQGYLFNHMMRSASKGRWVWQNLRRTNVPYYQEQSIITPSGVQHSNLTYEQIGERFAEEYKRFNIPLTESSEGILKTLINLFSRKPNIDLRSLDLMAIFNLLN